MKTELEKMGTEKIEKAEKMCQKQLVDKNEEIDELNTLVGKFQGKIKGQRDEVNTLKQNILNEQAENDRKNQQVTKIDKELAQKKLEIDAQNGFILQLKQENETLRTELQSCKETLSLLQ